MLSRLLSKTPSSQSFKNGSLSCSIRDYESGLNAREFSCRIGAEWFLYIDKQGIHMGHPYLPNGTTKEAPSVPSLDFAAQSEEEVRRSIHEWAARNDCGAINFMGGGAYDHSIPSAVEMLSMQRNFLTSYTQYQAEVNQGYLQALIEYQTMIAQLTDMEMAVGSHYDGATALAEAALMAVRIAHEKKNGSREVILVSEGVSPLYRRVLATIAEKGLGLTIKTLPLDVNGHTGFHLLPRELAHNDVACVIVQQPNFYGIIEMLEGVANAAHEGGALLIQSSYPIALGILKTPGEEGADIATGELQPLGLPLSYGGPYAGYLATKKEFLRQTPGRIVAESVDLEGSRAFTLAFGPREQHIRRFRATSNICSNQAHCTLRVVITLSLWGPDGLKMLAEHCYAKTQYVARAVRNMRHFRLVYPHSHFFNELLVEGPLTTTELANELGNIRVLTSERAQLGDRRFMIAVTEKRTKAELDKLIGSLCTIDRTYEELLKWK